MMIPGVKALVLAAATAALPFTPPAGWVQLPQSVVGAHATVWSGPKAGNGAQSTFTAIAMPFPGTVDMLASSPGTTGDAARILKPLSKASLTLCGTPARIVDLQVSAAGKRVLVQRLVSVKNGYAYMLVYARPAGVAANSGVEHAMRAYCPSGSADAPHVAMPAGWTTSSGDLEMAGMWMGTKPGQVMMLMRGSQMHSIDELFSSAQKLSLKGEEANNIVHITQDKSVAMCGYPGKLVDMNVNAGPMPMAIHMALTQAAGTSYVVLYTQPASASPDPAAVAALQTLCATGASPSPTPSPASVATPLRTPNGSGTF